MWRVAVLGPLAVQRDGAPLVLDALRQRERALLEILAVRHGHVVPRDELADRLFGHLDGDRAAANLRVAASRLRAALGAAALVEGRDGGYRLGPDCVVDTDEFESRADAGRIAFAEGRFDAAKAAFEAAIVLYRGELAEGEPRAEWAAPLRTRLGARRSEVLDELSDANLAVGLPREAAAIAERAIELDPTRESAYRRLMTARYASGEQDAALAAYDRCRRALSEELGVDPLPETMTLHERILRQEPIATPGARIPPRERRGLPFVARAPERIALEAAIARAGQECVLVLVVGEPGAGKTRLVDEALRARGDVTVFATRCYELERDLPFQPLRDALGDRAPAQTDGVVARGRAALIEEYARALLASGHGRPLVWTIDDVQWADRSTLDVLHFIARRAANAHVAVVATGRDDELPPEHVIVRLLTDLRREGRGDRIALMPLAADDVAALARASGADAERAAAIHARSGGNAFFVTELLMAMRHGISSLPETARDAVLARVHLLPKEVREAIEAASVLAGRFQIREVAGVASLEQDVAARAIGELETHDLVRPLPRGEYGLVHDLVREAIYEDMPAAVRARLHGRAIEAIDGARGAGGSSLVCYHAELAGDADCAFACAIVAGERALADHAGAEAVASFDRALRQPADVASRRRCLTLRAEAKRELGLLDDAKADADAAATLG